MEKDEEAAGDDDVIEPALTQFFDSAAVTFEHYTLEANAVRHLLREAGTTEDQLSKLVFDPRLVPAALEPDETQEGLPGAHRPKSRALRALAFSSLAFASLGAVFGDLGTSPLYTYASLFQDVYGKQGVPSEEDVRGGLACLFWALILSSTLKYQIFMMSASYNGQGGLFALLNALKWKGNLHGKTRTWHAFQALAIAGVALMTADAMLTSSVSVTSAIEGIGLEVPAFNGLANPAAFRATNALSAAVLCGIFALQALGSGRIGAVYAPVMLTWLIFIAAVGAYNIKQFPDVLRAWSPAQLWRFWTVGDYKGTASWRALGGIVLCLTGSEALYADMGHFGRGPIALAWFTAVFPALVLQYTGQSAYLLMNIELLSPDPADGPACAAVWHAGGACQSLMNGSGCCMRYTAAQDITANSFWHALPNRNIYRGMLAVATLASVVGSQSVITGVFTIYSQAAGLGIFPAVEVVQTSKLHQGQVFCPGINRVMFLGVLVIVGAFQHASNLVAVFGACVALAFLCDSLLRLGVAYHVQRWRWYWVLAVALPLLLMDGALATANVAKYFVAGPTLLGDGDPLGRSSWIALIPMIIVAALASTMSLWIWGRRALLLDAAKRTALLLALGMELQKDAATMRLEEALAAVRGGGTGSSPADAQQTQFLGTDPGANKPLRRAHSFQSSFHIAGVPVVGAVDDVVTHAALGTALALLAGTGALARPASVGVYLLASASLLDTEAMPEVAAETQREQPLELPHALLHAIAVDASLPQLTAILAVDFTPGAAFVAPSQRVRVRRIAGAQPDALPGVFHITVSYGWAERPKSSSEVISMLSSLGAAASEGGAKCPELAALSHTRCWLRPGDPCACSDPQAPTVCLPVRFIVSRDALRVAHGAPASLAAACGAFNFVAANFGTAADLLKLPAAAVVETVPPVFLHSGGASEGKEVTVKRARTQVARLRSIRGALES